MIWDLKKYMGSIAAIEENGNQIRYEELEEFVTEWKEQCKRTLVFQLCENSIGSLAGYIAMLQAGIVPVMIAKDLEIELFHSLLDTYQPDYIWLPSEQISVFPDYAIVFSKYKYTLLKTSYGSTEKLSKELALLLTTSGSTGSPKLVRQSYSNIRANTESIVTYLKLDASERPITTLPMNYTYGLSIIHSHLSVGATILLTEKSLMQKEFWEFFKRERATSFGGVPYIYEMLKKLRFFQMDLPSLRTMTQAGGKLTEELHKEFAEYAVKQKKNFVVMYGQTEATARMAYLPPEKALEKYGSMGIAIPGGRFELIDENGKRIDQENTVGELVYYGANVMLGYAECRNDLEKEDEQKGRLVTGDMAKRDSDGFYYIVGRKKRFLKLFGKRVNLDEIERLVKTQFKEIDCASSGMDDKLWIFVTKESLIKEIKHFITEKIQIHFSAVEVAYIENIPKNNAGKTLYVELEKYYK